MSTAAIEIKDWSVFRNGRKLVGPLTIRCLPGEAVVITGPSGVGKTSLLHSCLGVSEEGLTAQGIRLEGGALLADKELPRSLAVYIPQAHPFNPNWEVTSFLCRLPWGEWKWWHNVWPETPERRRTVLSVLKRLGLAHRARATVAELSGGEIKRAALAQLYLLRTTAKLFVADEFVNGVDPGMTQSILAECRSIISDTGAAALMAMHDVFAALQIADQIVVLWPVQTNAAPWVLRKGDAAWNPETLHSLLCLSRWAEEHPESAGLRGLIGGICKESFEPGWTNGLVRRFTAEGRQQVTPFSELPPSLLQKIPAEHSAPFRIEESGKQLIGIAWRTRDDERCAALAEMD